MSAWLTFSLTFTILLHRTAKKKFDDLGLKKLPTIKNLQLEYTKLLAQKKKYRAEYRSSRQEMRNLLSAKANVDRLLTMDTATPQAKSHLHENQR